MASKNGFHLFLTMLAFSLLISSAASRAMHMQGYWGVSSPEDASQTENMKGDVEMVEDEFFHGRMDFQINRDYPGSGANNRHTPVPQVID